MPRYRFSWDNTDADLRRELCDRDVDTPAEAAQVLRQRYGARPKADFVADHWDVLRDRWLAADPTARQRVVTELRAAGLGDASIQPVTPDQEMAYLRSCRNKPTLRRVVLAAFISAGERSPGATKSAPPGPTWQEFETALAGFVDHLEPDQCLILSVRGTGASSSADSLPASSYFVQFAASEGGLRIEAVSNTYLSPDERLGPEAQMRLAQLGWQPPTHLPGQEAADPTGSPNYFRDFDAPLPSTEIAQLAAVTLRDVYRAGSPKYLYAAAWSPTGTIDPSALGVESPPQQPTNVSSGDIEALLPQPASPDELRLEIERTLAPMTGGETIVYDDDRDIPIRFGSTQVYVRYLNDEPYIRVFAILLGDLAVSWALLETLNDLNRSYPFMKFYLDGNAIVAEIDVHGIKYVGAHLISAISSLGAVADELDDDLQSQFGGRTFFGERQVPDQPTPSAGYI